MSLAAVRPYFRTRLESLNFHEHDDAFTTENIPGTILDRAFHIESGIITAGESNQRDHQFDLNVIIRVYLKGFRNIVEALDDSMGEAQTILTDLLDPTNRLTESGILNIVPNSVTPIPLTEDNDNVIVLEMDFNIKILLCF